MYTESDIQLQSRRIESISLRQNMELKIRLHIAYVMFSVLHVMFYTSVIVVMSIIKNRSQGQACFTNLQWPLLLTALRRFQSTGLLL